MLISKIMEETPPVMAIENMSNRLADNIRNIWLEKQKIGFVDWEESFAEDSDGIAFLREESFPYLQGIDYIFKWWGNDDMEGLSGELEVIWKVNYPTEENMVIYKTWIRFAERDFIMGNFHQERQKREANRNAFFGAFTLWREVYMRNVNARVHM